MDNAAKGNIELLLKLDKLCKEHYIQYFLDYGTLLGAVRHEGFIPGHSAVCLSMTEQNYDKFKEVSLGSGITVTDCRTSRECSDTFATVTGDDGSSLEIFLLLEMPAGHEERCELIDLFFVYHEYTKNHYKHFGLKNPPQYELYKNCLDLEEELGKDGVMKQLESKIFGNSFSCDMYLVCASAEKVLPYTVPKELYSSATDISFEGHKLPVPSNYSELLDHYYGDAWCELKDIEDPKPEMHIQNESIRLAVEEDYICTEWTIETLNKIEAYEKTRLQRNFDAKNVKNVLDYLTADDRPSMTYLLDCFDSYLKRQLDSTVVGWDFCIDIGDDNLYAVLFCLIYLNNDLASASKILAIREGLSRPLTDELNGIWDLITTSRKVKAEMIYERFDKAEETVNEGLKAYPELCNLLIAKLILDVRKTRQEGGSWSKCMVLAELLQERYPHIDEYRPALSEILTELGRPDLAAQHFKRALEETDNIMVRLYAKKRLEAMK